MGSSDNNQLNLVDNDNPLEYNQTRDTGSLSLDKNLRQQSDQTQIMTDNDIALESTVDQNGLTPIIKTHDSTKVKVSSRDLKLTESEDCPESG